MDFRMNQYSQRGARFVLVGFLLVAVGRAADKLPQVDLPKVAVKDAPPQIKPVVPERKFTVPVIPQEFHGRPEQTLTATNNTVETVQRLRRAMKEVRLLEIWSLDPSVDPKTGKELQTGLPGFHGFQSIGHDGLKDKEEVQDLLLAVALSIAKGPDETMECFEPRHALRLYDQKGFIDVVLCYTCLQGVIYDGEKEEWFSTARDAEADFDAVFKKLNLKKAE